MPEGRRDVLRPSGLPREKPRVPTVQGKALEVPSPAGERAAPHHRKTEGEKRSSGKEEEEEDCQGVGVPGGGDSTGGSDDADRRPP